MTDLINKLRGGYYTPNKVARFICNWAITSPSDNILEPSCGDGAFIAAAHERLSKLGCTNPEPSILGIELYDSEAKKAAKCGGRVITGDFFTFCTDKINGAKYDAIVGNPPFIRYQDFEERYREKAFELMHRYGFSPNRLTNIWLPFLVVCSHLISDRGRLGMVIPAELFQVKYASETRHFLMDYFESVSIVTFENLIFENAQQEVILLLAERHAKDKDRGVRIIELKDADSLATLTPRKIQTLQPKRKLPDSTKWQAYYLDQRTIDLVSRLLEDPHVRRCSNLFDVNVGLVSGQNSFFVLDKSTAEENSILNSCVPIISRSFQLDGLCLTDADYESQVDLGRKVLLFLPKNRLSAADLQYVKKGEMQGVNKNYKCRIRTPWYQVPTSWKPDAFFYRQVGAYPRIVLNKTAAYSTDTLHKIRFHTGVHAGSAIVSFNNSLTFLMSELMGRSYGGGVLTFEPSESRDLPIPYDPSAEFDFEMANHLVRQERTEELIAHVDKVLLEKYLGLSSAEVSLLHAGWQTLRSRRMRRKKR
ncbi:MAG: class I SAM-dependent methyltransferase [Coriobacteriaceae bacterium]|nr:MAG: class I SAM-dependent methyltransferase [Coriobacteriaceae bacterium]